MGFGGLGWGLGGCAILGGIESKKKRYRTNSYLSKKP